MFFNRIAVLIPILLFLWALTPRPAGAQTDSTIFFRAPDSLLSGPIVSCLTAMETAWDLVRNPLEDSIAGGPELADRIRQGFRIFLQTPKYAPSFSGNALSCGHCHLNAGQREKALPLVGVAAVFPQYNKRAGTIFTLTDRIVGCFMRSMNAPAAPGMMPAHDPQTASAALLRSEEVRALEAYLTWLSEGYTIGGRIGWRGQNTIPKDSLLPLGSLDSLRGAELFLEKCVTCHGEDGQGVAIGDIKAGPLWGPASWNDGAGAARVYTLAGIIRYMMPYIDPGSLTDEEAQQIAFFICSRERPAYPYKEFDYRTEPMPVDAVYYPRER